MKRVTQESIAKRLGVHVSTVSKILNRDPKAVFARDTVQRVLSAAERFGYSGGRRAAKLRDALAENDQLRAALSLALTEIARLQAGARV